MQVKDYIPLAIRTESPKETGLSRKHTRLLHAAIGVATETAELVQADTDQNQVEELGDAAWYLAAATDAIGAQSLTISSGGRENRVRAKELSRELHILSGDFLDQMKKLVFYGKEPNEANLTMTVFNLWQTVANLSAAKGHDFGIVLEANIRKLRIRYPEKFTSEAAVNRNLDAEAESLRQ